jgi:hypothetical protein
MPVMTSSRLHAWWADLRHSGLVVAPALLEEVFPTGLDIPKPYSYQRLRERYSTFEAWCQREKAYESGSDSRPLYSWLDGILDLFLGHEGARWQKGSNVSATWTHETLLQERLRPHRILFHDTAQREPALFVWIEQTRQLGQGQGRNAYGKLLELLRAKNMKLGLLTNGRQFRLCYAGLDYDSWAEWDVESWFAEEELRRQLHGFYTLLGPTGVNPRNGYTFPLLQAADASRTRQGELSTVLGEQVREAIETLLGEVNLAVRDNPALFEKVRFSPQGVELSQRRILEALYQAATRIIMRLVIILFAEARDLLPRSLSAYSTSYGLEGLYEQLRRAAQHEGRNALEERQSAWIRLLSLFHMIYAGSSSPVIPIHAYGGMLFRPGQFDHTDATLRAMALFEYLDVSISDATILHLLELLKNGKIKIRQGRTSRWVVGPVDFSELRTEYIGLMYQGLLDFNLHSATDQPMIFLNLGQEPVLPLTLLEEMPDQHLKDLLKKLSTEKSQSLVAEEGEGSDEEGNDVELVQDAAESDDVSVADETEVEEEVFEASEEAEEATTLTEADQLKQRALTWARRAVEVGGLVKKPKGKQKDTFYLYEKEREKRAHTLIKRVLDQGEFYLIRRGGTRKGSGTFYTKPQLAVPITRHTLEPLLYAQSTDGIQLPKTPEEILALKVCDPACGSASFLVAALHYITDALYQSLVYHRRIFDRPEEVSSLVAITLPFGTPSQARPEEELIPVRPNHERFEVLMKARLRRYVVERCLYGVDLSALAVELAHMSLWIETMDRELPFTFLDHKIKVGNSLIGGWFDTFLEYPIMAWMRDGGDANHNNGVHYKAKEWTKALNKERNEIIKPELIKQIESSSSQLFLFSENQQQTPEGLHKEITAEMEQLHELPITDEQEREVRYRAMQQRTDYQEIKRAFNEWCAAWFWPADQLEYTPTPATFYNPSSATRDLVEDLAAELHFFHWELEFPDVFARSVRGFDAILGNPPWEIAKPYSQEFFTDYDPLYRTYGKQEALSEQEYLFEHDQMIEREWLRYQAYFKSLSNWTKHAASPFGDPTIKDMDAFSLKSGKIGEQLHNQWRKRRSDHYGYADRMYPFRYQGSTGAGLNTYKLFLEIAHHLLKQGGQLGMLVPSSIYTDQGSGVLRSLFLNHCSWQWLFGFINWQRIFDIDSRFKFAVLLLEKGRSTEQLRVAFNQVALSQLEQPDNVMLAFPRRQVEQFSPKSLTIVEPQTQRDLDVLEKLYANNTVLLNDQSERGWQIQHTREEFNMTRDSFLFPPLPKWIANGYQSDGYGHWIGPGDDIALPLYEGRMVGPFDPSEKGWVRGKGRSAVWREISFEDKVFEPQYLLSFDAYHKEGSALKGLKISFINIGSATNTRSMYATLVSDMPCGDTAPVLQPAVKDAIGVLSLIACFNSFTYDYALRCRLGGIHLSYFVIAETPLPVPRSLRKSLCAKLAARLNLIMPSFAPQWLELRKVYPHLADQHWRKLWAITEHERLRLRCILDAIIAELYGLSYDDFAWILRDDPSNPKGFWRVDKEKPKELRHTTLALAALKRLKEVGLETFSQEDWQFPSEIGERLGPRFTPWQEQGTVVESWAECEEHARRMKALSLPLPEKDQKERKEKKNGQAEKAQGRQLELWSM